MTTPDFEQAKARQEQELRIQRQIAFASGLFQGDVTIRTLLESLVEGVVIIDNSGTILLVNSSAEQMFGYPKKALIGKPQAVLIPERFRKVLEEHEAGYFKEPRIRPVGQPLDLSGSRQDGSEFPVEISLSFIETINGVLVLALVSDITLRKQFESRLRESEELFHIQMECVKDHAFFMLDPQGNVLNWNAGAERLRGYEEKEIIGKHFSCFYSEEERKAGKPEEELGKAATDGRFEAEGWRISKGGSRFWGNVIITAIRDENGNLRGFSDVVRDITERKKAEDTLRLIEARYRALYYDNPTMIVTLDADLTVLSANPFCASQLGYTIDELEGQSVLKLFHEDDRPAVAKQLRTCLQNLNQVNRWQFRKVRKDGGLLWVEETAQAVHDLNGTLNILIVCQDITARKQLEAEIQDAREYAENIVETVREPLVVLNSDLKILTANHSFYDTFKVTHEETIGHFIYDLGNRQWDIPKLRVLFEDILPLDTVFNGYAVEHDFLGIGRKIMLLNARQIFREKIGSHIILLAMEDITERKFAEAEIERLNTDLAARAADLEDANRVLEAFNYTVAHDLRKPLTVVNGYCQTLREFCSDKLNEACKGYLREAYDGTLRMNRLIDALLNFSRLAHVETRRETVALSVMAHVVAAELKLTEPERRVEFRIADGISADADAALLRVVLDNLLGNAWKYTGRREEGLIEFGATEVDGIPAYFVRDNGTGFDMADADKLFIPFQRLPGAEEFKGFGIGLATVERIIRRHGGKVWAEGTPDKGATFFFTLSGDRTI